MPEFHLSEDDAGRYVLGELTGVERREFEARLAQSAELRALVGELEEGAMALSMTPPRRRPPQEVWRRIEKSVTGQTRWKLAVPSIWVGWWRHGWAAAAACLAGWLLYALWVNWPRSSGAVSAPVASEVNPQRATTLADSHGDKTGNVTPQSNGENKTTLQFLQARMQEIGALRWQIAGLTNRVIRLSQTLTQQQALLAEPNRLKFFQLLPPAAGSIGTTIAPVSPDLQRALLLAMARELGWVPPAVSSDAAGKGSGQEERSKVSDPARTNHAEVDFVDLRATSNSVETSATLISQPQTELEPTGAPESSALASAPSNAVPGFVSGTNAVLAFDSSVVPAGGSVTFLTVTSWGQFQSLGTARLGNNPMVVTIPFGVSSWAGGNVTVVAATADGVSNVIGQFSTQGVISP